MGLYKIDNASSEEQKRRAIRRHEAKQWMITLAEIGAVVGLVILWSWLIRWLDI